MTRCLLLVTSALALLASIPNARQLLRPDPRLGYSTGSATEDATTADFDGDGLVDVAVVSELGLTVFMGNGDGTLFFHSAYPIQPDPIRVLPIQAGSRMNLLTVSRRGVDFFENDGAGFFTLRGSLSFSLLVDAVPIPGRPDFTAVVDTAASEVIFVRSNGSSGLLEWSRFPVTGFPDAAAAGNLDNDSRIELVVFRQTPRGFVILDLDGAMTNAVQFSVPHSVGVDDLVIADFDQDGFDDVVTTEPAGDALTVFHNQGLAVLAPPVRHSIGPNPRHLRTGDLDGNGLEDFLVLHGSDPMATVRLRQVDGSLSPNSEISLGANGGRMALGDLDLNGMPDLVHTAPGLLDGLGLHTQRDSWHTFRVGEADVFRPGPTEWTSPRPELVTASLGLNPVQYLDNPGKDEIVLHTFSGLPRGKIIGASLALRFAGRTSEHLHIGHDSLFNNFWIGALADVNPVQVGSFVYEVLVDLDNIPPGFSGPSSVLHEMNRDGHLDVRVRDDVAVDYMELQVQMGRPAELVHDRNSLIVGQTTTLTATGGAEGEAVYFLTSPFGLGDQMAASSLRWTTLLKPFPLISVPTTAGVASLSLPIPALPGIRLGTQAILPHADGTWETSNVIFSPVYY